MGPVMLPDHPLRKDFPRVLSEDLSTQLPTRKS